MIVKAYNKNIFINCPFDMEFLNIFRAQVFCVFDCGFIPRCALEENDGANVRIDKIFNIIAQCKYGIHDISRTELCKTTKLPRFNMPLELGMFLGARKFGDADQKKKNCLITDKEAYRYQSYISDIAGQDIVSHGGNPEDAIRVVSKWLRDSAKRNDISGGDAIVERYAQFSAVLPLLCKNAEITLKEMSHNDYCQFVSAWLKSQTERYVDA